MHIESRSPADEASTCRVALLSRWCLDAGVMHIAHHKAASRCATQHMWLGGGAAALAAVVGSSVFASLTAQTSPYLTIVTGFASVLAAFMMALHTFFNCHDRAGKHIAAAAKFQKVRRDLEEEKARLEDGAFGPDSYSELLSRWQKAITTAPPLPQGIHDNVKRTFEEKHKLGNLLQLRNPLIFDSNLRHVQFEEANVDS